MKESSHCTDFKTLRLAYVEVRKFIEDETGDNVESLKTKLEYDMGLEGDDNYELLQKFVIKYKLGVTGFEYSKHFLDEEELFNSGTALVNLLMLPVVLLRRIIEFFSFGKIHFVRKKRFPNSWRATLDLSFGDMLVWYLTGTYNLRSNTIVSFQISE